jgi:hypothetical protein
MSRGQAGQGGAGRRAQVIRERARNGARTPESRETQVSDLLF